MKKITISDMTLALCAEKLSFKEKIETARQLDNLNADYIEMPDIKNQRTDSLLIGTVSAFIKHSRISVCAGMSRDEIDTAVSAASAAREFRLRVALPTSAVQMEYLCHKKAKAMFELASDLFAYASGKCGDVEFFAQDASRAEPAFLYDMIRAARQAGVRTVTLCDNAGVMLPDEFFDYVSSVKEQFPDIRLGVFCENGCGMVNALAAMALKAGADEIKCCTGKDRVPDIDGVGGIVKEYGERIGVSSSLKYTELHRGAGQIKWIFGEKSGSSAAPVEYGKDMDIPLDSKDGIEAVSAAVKKLGYDISEEDEKKVYDEFLRVAEKKNVGARELDAIVASVALAVPPTYKLISYVINNGNIISSSAQITLMRDGKELSGVSMGDGPVDAAFRAIEQITGRHYELDDFSIQSVTEGRDSVGSAIVKLRRGGRLYSGNGISTDIIGASIRAYVSAVNKIAYEETEA